MSAIGSATSGLYGLGPGVGLAPTEAEAQKDRTPEQGREAHPITIGIDAVYRVVNETATQIVTGTKKFQEDQELLKDEQAKEKERQEREAAVEAAQEQLAGATNASRFVDATPPSQLIEVSASDDSDTAGRTGPSASVQDRETMAGHLDILA